MIESYVFGRMTISGKVYTSDLIVFPDRILSGWWRNTGHRLCLEDLKEVLVEDFEVLVVGTGFMGLMKVDQEVLQYARSHAIQLVIEKTKKAAEDFNNLFSRKKAVGAFHLTC
jgi:hypothetical protein